jgi:AraC-like DNA-binding protein/mannose-6-phosphate isomerase-like protein (cupin superfamily)
VTIKIGEEMYHNYIFEEFSKNEDKISVRRSVYIDNNLPMHGHSFMEIVYIESGEGTHYLNDKEYTVRAGDLILLDYRSIHTFRPITANFEWINILFKPEFIKDRLFHEVGANNVIRLSLFKTLIDNTDGKFHDLVLSGVNSSFTSLVHLMLYEYENLSRESNYILRNYLVILLSKVSFYVQNGPTGTSENVNVLIRQITQEILENLQNELTLSYVANKVHLTPKYLSRFFKQQTGKNFIDFVHEKRIEEACRLLEQTDMAVNDIMFCCGMKSSKFFYKLFKEKTGVTPGDYRKI